MTTIVKDLTVYKKSTYSKTVIILHPPSELFNTHRVITSKTSRREIFILKKNKVQQFKLIKFA